MGAARAVPVLLGLFAVLTPVTIAGAHASLAAAVAAGLASADSRRRMAELRRHPLALPIALWCLASIVSVVFAVDPERSLPKLKKLALLPLIPLGALPEVRRAIRPIIPALIASAAVVSLWGLVVFARAGGGLDERLSGISGFYMTVAGILMLVGLVCLAEILAALKDPHPRRVVFLVVSAALILGALAATYTRGSWLGFLAGAVWVLRRRPIVLVSLAVVAALLLLLGPPAVRERVVANLRPDHPRNQERVLIWQRGIELVKERPWTGLGLVIPEDRMGGEIQTPQGTLRVHSHMHNAYLQIAVSMGIPALLIFGWFVVAMFRMARRAERVVIWSLWEEGLVAAVPACVIALAVNGLVEWNFGDSEILGLFYCLAGLALGVETGAGET
ncbi:MAG: O-antigen ligase family protein [Candidatus Eiseniibacteriota bacterium]